MEIGIDKYCSNWFWKMGKNNKKKKLKKFQIYVRYIEVKIIFLINYQI